MVEKIPDEEEEFLYNTENEREPITWREILGWIIAIIGFIFLFIKAFGTTTGFIISETINSLPNYSYLFGLGLLIVGAVLVLIERR